MKKRVKSNLITLGIILVIITISVLILEKPHPETSEEIAKCIGENSELYIQLGCHACETQEEMFGENYQYLTVIDCFYERDKCGEITATPTWKIGGENTIGVQSIEELQKLTGC